LVDVVLSSDTVVVLGGPEAIEVETGVGAQGNRGSLWFSGVGNPNLLNLVSDFVTLPQPLDRFIDVDPDSETYLTVFEYLLSDGSSPSWTERFSLDTSPQSVNEVLSFTAGNAIVNLDITNLGIDSSFVESFVNSFAFFNVQATASNIDASLAPLGISTPMAFSISVDDAFYDNTGIEDSQEVPLKLPISVDAVEFDGSNWSPVDDKSIIMYFTVSYANPNTIISNLVAGGS